MNWKRGAAVGMVAVLGGASAVVLVQPASAREAPASPSELTSEQPRYGPPYPFTASELWAKLARVIAIPDGRVTRAEVEKIFGVRLRQQKLDSNTPNTTEFKLAARTEWYFERSCPEPWCNLGVGDTAISG